MALTFMVFLHSPRWSSGKLPRSGGVACALPVLDIEAALIARQGGEATRVILRQFRVDIQTNDTVGSMTLCAQSTPPLHFSELIGFSIL